MSLLSILFGMIVGFSLGLTGGGGAIFAVPLLVYGLEVEPRQAVGISLAAVGTMAAIGLMGRWRMGQVEPRTGLIFAVAGMIAAPLGSWLSHQIPPLILLLLFAILMLVVAVRMWTTASTAEGAMGNDCNDDDHLPTCRRDAAGKLRITSRCAALLVAAGAVTGVMSGLFGVGGGFVIVPALVLFSGMAMHRAVGTSLLVIALISLVGTVSHMLAGGMIPIGTALLFVLGGIGGMGLGAFTSRRLSSQSLQQSFAVAIVGVAIFVIVQTLRGTA